MSSIIRSNTTTPPGHAYEFNIYGGANKGNGTYEDNGWAGRFLDLGTNDINPYSYYYTVPLQIVSGVTYWQPLPPSGAPIVYMDYYPSDPSKYVPADMDAYRERERLISTGVLTTGSSSSSTPATSSTVSGNLSISGDKTLMASLAGGSTASKPTQVVQNPVEIFYGIIDSSDGTKNGYANNDIATYEWNQKLYLSVQDLFRELGGSCKVNDGVVTATISYSGKMFILQYNLNEKQNLNNSKDSLIYASMERITSEKSSKTFTSVFSSNGKEYIDGSILLTHLEMLFGQSVGSSDLKNAPGNLDIYKKGVSSLSIDSLGKNNLGSYLFASEYDAVYAFGTLYNPITTSGEYLEYGVVIVQWDNGYTLSNVVEGGKDGAGRNIRVNDEVNRLNRENQKVVAFIHTHPYNEYFTDTIKNGERQKEDYRYGYKWDYMERLYIVGPQGQVRKSERVSKETYYANYTSGGYGSYEKPDGSVIYFTENVKLDSIR